MGLDNIPHHYPCKTQGTVIIEDRLDKDGNVILDEDGNPFTDINCKKTQDAGGCPFMNEYNKVSDKIGTPVHGMLGTDCWYRGKWGQWLIEDSGLADGWDDEDLSFYGNNEDRTSKSSASCDALADAIDDFLMDEPDWKASEGKGDASDLRYASWYLRWASQHTGGLDCWY
jgi:hypothetical protein